MKGTVKFSDIFSQKARLPHFPGSPGWYVFEYDDISIQLSIGSHVDITYNFSNRNANRVNDFYSRYINPIWIELNKTKNFIIMNDSHEAKGCKILSCEVNDIGFFTMNKCILKIRADIFTNLDISKRREETINTLLNY